MLHVSGISPHYPACVTSVSSVVEHGSPLLRRIGVALASCGSWNITFVSSPTAPVAEREAWPLPAGPPYARVRRRDPGRREYRQDTPRSQGSSARAGDSDHVTSRYRAYPRCGRVRRGAGTVVCTSIPCGLSATTPRWPHQRPAAKLPGILHCRYCRGVSITLPHFTQPVRSTGNGWRCPRRHAGLQQGAAHVVATTRPARGRGCRDCAPVPTTWSPEQYRRAGTGLTCQYARVGGRRWYGAAIEGCRQYQITLADRAAASAAAWIEYAPLPTTSGSAVMQAAMASPSACWRL